MKEDEQRKKMTSKKWVGKVKKRGNEEGECNIEKEEEGKQNTKRYRVLTRGTMRVSLFTKHKNRCQSVSIVSIK